MFSFEKGSPLFYLVDKNGKKQETIFYSKEPRGGKALISVEDPCDILTDDDFKLCKRKHRFSEYDIVELRRLMQKSGGNLEHANNGAQARAMRDLNAIVDDRLKKSLIFDDNDYRGWYLVPAVPGAFTVISIVGPSGSGKSTIAADIIWHNMRKGKPMEEEEIEDKMSKMGKKKGERWLKRLKKDTGKVFLISRQVGGALDPALQKLEKYIEVVDVFDLENMPTLEDFTNSWVLVDDIEGLPKQIRDSVQDVIDGLVTCGRKLGIKVIYSTHNFAGWSFRHMKNESKLHIVFPKVSKHKIHDWLRLGQKWPTADINRFFKEAGQDSSHRAFFGLSHPSYYGTDSRIQLL